MAVPGTDARAFWIENNDNWGPLWERDSNYDDLHVQVGNASFTGPSDAGGTHLHADTTGHIEVGVPHDHPISAGMSNNESGRNVGGGTVKVISAKDHDHDEVDSAAAVIEYDSASLTVSTVTAKVKHVRVVVLKPTKPAADLPAATMVLGDSGTLPKKCSKIGGAHEGLYLRGAAAGLYGGSIDGDGSHGHVADPHGHGVQDHGHVEVDCGNPPAAETRNGTLTVRGMKHHKVGLTDRSMDDVSDEVVPIDDVAEYLPAYIELLGMAIDAGEPVTPVGVVLGWVGTPGSVPSNYSVVTDAYDRQPRITLVSNDVGDTGGDNDHTHDAGEHGHEHEDGNHPHGYTLTWQQDTGATAGSNPALNRMGFPYDSHFHPVWTIGAVTATIEVNDGTEITLDAADGRPAYRTMLLVRKDSMAVKSVTAGGIHGTEDLVMAA